MNFLEIILPYAVEIAATIVITLIGILGSIVSAKIAKHKELANITEAISQVTQMTQDTVLELKQTVSDTWKEHSEDGKLTPEQIKILQEELLAKTISKLAQPTIVLLDAAKVDINALIKSVAEALIANLNTAE